MIQIIADNIISGLGGDTASCLRAIRSGVTSLAGVSDYRLPDGETAVVSKMNDSFLEPLNGEADMTRLEKFMITSVKRACKDMYGILSDRATVFVFSTTKGNVKYLGKDDAKTHLWHSSEKVSDYFGNPNRPITVSNACISGVAAVIVAKRLLEAGLYKVAVVVGSDELTEFTVSGFASLMALSGEACRPFDIMRHGLNLGEAVGTLVLRRAENKEDVLERDGYFQTPQFVTAGAVASDAYHISSPSRTGEGLYRAILRTLSYPYGGKAEVKPGEAFVNPHGTATLYNDQMESMAFSRCGLGEVPLVPLKGYFGHTLGASGVIETILSCHFLDEGCLPPAAGYSEPGCVPSPLINPYASEISSNWFLKTISGFGGSNAAIRVEKFTDALFSGADKVAELPQLCVKNSFSIDFSGNVKEHLSSLYRDSNLRYPKFHKMDLLCKAGVLAADRLLEIPEEGDDRTALVFMNSSSSFTADSEYLASIADDNFYPSPSVFVYTLPNIVTGEISIRHKLFGEGAFFVCPSFDRGMALDYIRCLFREGAASKALLCWDECREDECRVYAELIATAPVS